MKRLKIVISSCSADLDQYQTITQCFDEQLQNLQNEVQADLTTSCTASELRDQYLKAIFPKDASNCEKVLNDSQEITQVF